MLYLPIYASRMRFAVPLELLIKPSLHITASLCSQDRRGQDAERAALSLSRIWMRHQEFT